MLLSCAQCLSTHRYFCSDVRLDLELFRCQMETWRTIDAVGVEQRHGGHVEPGTGRYQFLGQGRSFEEAESRAGVKLDVQVLSCQSQFSVKNIPDSVSVKIFTEN